MPLRAWSSTVQPKPAPKSHAPGQSVEYRQYEQSVWLALRVSSRSSGILVTEEVTRVVHFGRPNSLDMAHHPASAHQLLSSAQDLGPPESINAPALVTSILLHELPARLVYTLLPLILMAPYKLDRCYPSREAETLSTYFPHPFQNYNAKTRGMVLFSIQCLLRALKTLLEEEEQDEYSHVCEEHGRSILTQEVECLGRIASYFKLQDSEAPRHSCMHDIEYLETRIKENLGRAEFHESRALVALIQSSQGA